MLEQASVFCAIEVGSAMKTIMIVGAGKAQVPLINAAKKEHYHTVVCDLDPDAPGVPLADEYCGVSTKDRDGLLKTAREKRIDGIAANSEYAMGDVACIAGKLGLVGNPENSIAILSSKSRFRKLQKQIGLFAPRFAAADSDERLKEFPLPAMIKPDASSGSRGVTLISEPEGRETGLKRARNTSRNRKAIIEEYIPMPSLAVIEGEIFVNHGEILWDGLFSNLRSPASPLLPMTYVFPLPETQERTEAAKTALKKMLQAAGIIHGEYNIELYIANTGEPFIIEINPRQGGYELPRLAYEHCGIDFYRLLVTTAMGDDDYWKSLKEFKRENRLLVHHMLFPRSAGPFKGIEIAESLSDKVFRSEIEIEDGAFVNGTVDAASCIGFVDLQFDSVEDQLAVSSRLEELIRVKVE